MLTGQKDVAAAGLRMQERLDELVMYQTWKSWSRGPGQQVFHSKDSFRCKAHCYAHSYVTAYDQNKTLGSHLVTITLLL